MFEVTGPHYCKVCEPIINKKGRRLDQPLELIVSNYSGRGVDIAMCTTCEHKFQISYKVDDIIDITQELSESKYE